LWPIRDTFLPPVHGKPNGQIEMSKKNLAPKYLGPSGKAFWKKIVADYEIENHHAELLGRACKTIDRLEEIRKVLDAEGCFVVDRFGQKREHPGVHAETQYKILLSRLLREIGLDLGEAEAPRMNRLGGQRY
jgi:P27 family predicted phage terminase small subunit